jgi:phosphatidylglycerophosphate synthase
MINPVDKLFNYIGDKMNPVLYNFGFTPNILTSFSFLFGLVSMYYFYVDKRILAACLFIINYFFDVIDGRFARKYNMTTTFGDYYDHITDWITILLLLIIMYIKNSWLLLKLSPFLIILVILSLISLGCSQKKRTKIIEKSNTIGFTEHMCINKTVSNIAEFLNITFLSVVIFFVIIFYK